MAPSSCPTRTTHPLDTALPPLVVMPPPKPLKVDDHGHTVRDVYMCVRTALRRSPHRLAAKGSGPPMLLRAPCAAAGGPGSGLALLQVKEQPALQM